MSLEYIQVIRMQLLSVGMRKQLKDWMAVFCFSQGLRKGWSLFFYNW